MQKLSQADFLTELRSLQKLGNLSQSDDESLLLRAGIVPKTLIARFYGTYPETLIYLLVRKGKVEETPNYLRAKPSSRTRPIMSAYDIEKPRLNRLQRYKTTYYISGRDRHALWAAGANTSVTASRGESYGLFRLLEFFRLPHIQRNWRRHISNPKFKLPEEAR